MSSNDMYGIKMIDSECTFYSDNEMYSYKEIRKQTTYVSP